MHLLALILLIISIFHGFAVFSGQCGEHFGDHLVPSADSDPAMLDIDRRSNFTDFYDGLWHWQEVLQNDPMLQQIAMLQQQQQLLDNETHRKPVETETDLPNLLPYDHQQQLLATVEQQQNVDETSWKPPNLLPYDH